MESGIEQSKIKPLNDVEFTELRAYYEKHPAEARTMLELAREESTPKESIVVSPTRTVEQTQTATEKKQSFVDILREIKNPDIGKLIQILEKDNSPKAMAAKEAIESLPKLIEGYQSPVNGDKYAVKNYRLSFADEIRGISEKIYAYFNSREFAQTEATFGEDKDKAGTEFANFILFQKLGRWINDKLKSINLLVRVIIPQSSFDMGSMISERSDTGTNFQAKQTLSWIVIDPKEDRVLSVGKVITE